MDRIDIKGEAMVRQKRGNINNTTSNMSRIINLKCSPCHEQLTQLILNTITLDPNLSIKNTRSTVLLISTPAQGRQWAFVIYSSAEEAEKEVVACWLRDWSPTYRFIMIYDGFITRFYLPYTLQDELNIPNSRIIFVKNFWEIM